MSWARTNKKESDQAIYTTHVNGYQRFTVQHRMLQNIPSGSRVLVLLERKLCVTEFYTSEGGWVYGAGNAYHVPHDKVFGCVIE